MVCVVVCVVFVYVRVGAWVRVGGFPPCETTGAGAYKAAQSRQNLRRATEFFLEMGDWLDWI
jgi:hypothetical protein